jgi:hypothetical protein
MNEQKTLYPVRTYIDTTYLRNRKVQYKKVVVPCKSEKVMVHISYGEAWKKFGKCTKYLLKKLRMRAYSL